MPLSAPRDSTIAVVGDGFGSLIVYSTAVYLGFRPEQITVYGPSEHPVTTYQQFALQPRPDGAPLRVGVALPAGRLADVRAARRVVAPQPGAAPPLDRGGATTPASPEILAEATTVAAAARLGRAARAGRRSAGSSAELERRPPHFVLYDEDAQLPRPREARDARARPRAALVPARARARRARTRAWPTAIVQAYEPKKYDARRPLRRDRRRASRR